MLLMDLLAKLKAGLADHVLSLRSLLLNVTWVITSMQRRHMSVMASQMTDNSTVQHLAQNNSKVASEFHIIGPI